LNAPGNTGGEEVHRRGKKQRKYNGAASDAIAEQEDASTHLLHNAGFALGEGNVATRLVADELDLDLATLATALVVVVVVVIRGGLALALDTASLGGPIGLLVLELIWRGLVVLFSDVGHCLQIDRVARYQKLIKYGGDAVLGNVPDALYWI
jgi:hypothetical protein